MRRALVLLTAASLSFASFAPPAWAAVTATPVRMREVRTKELQQADKKRPQFFMDNELAITLKLSGPELKDATEFKDPTVTAATDDTGASLVNENRNAFGDDEGFRPIHRMDFEFDEKGNKKPPSSDFETEVQLKAPSRQAKVLKTVKGTVAVRAGGDKKQVAVKNIKSMAGKPIDDPALKAANLTIKFVAPKAGAAAGDTVQLEITGDRTPIKSIDVVDAAGEKVSQGHSAFGNNKVTQYEVFMPGPVQDTMTLQINLVTGQKVIEVPFELKDVALP